MDDRTKRTLASGAIVSVGVVQTLYGLGRGDLVYAGIGSAFALVGVLFFWAEVYRVDA